MRRNHERQQILFLLEAFGRLDEVPLWLHREVHLLLQT